MKIKAIKIMIVMLFIVLAFISAVNALSFSSDPIITPTNATTVSPLVCSWESVGAIQTNISWYNGSTLISTIVGATSPQTLSETLTRKGQSWNCTVIISNTTSTIKRSDKLIIENALPSRPNAINRTLYENSYFSTFITATDPDNDPLIYIAICPTCNFDSFNQNTGFLEWMPSYDDVGNHTIIFQASDDGGISGVGIKVVWEIIAINDPPRFDPPLEDQEAIENTLFVYNINATDREDDPIYFYDNSDMFDINLTTGLISFIPQHYHVGTHEIQINVTDGMNTTVSGFTLTINATNHPPFLVPIQNYSMLQNETLVVNLTGYDFDNDTVVFSALSQDNYWFSVETINGTNIYGQINATGRIIFSPADENVGNNTIYVNITDAKGLSSTRNFTLEVINTNDHPIIYPIPNQTAIINDQFTLQVNATDPDLDKGDYITFSDDSPIFEINSTTGLISFMPNSSHIGNYSITITVTDSFGLSNYTIFNLRVINNSAPFFNEEIVNQTGYVYSLFTLQINATDPDGDNITFIDNSSFFDIDPITGLINFTPKKSDVGNHSIKIYITDIFEAGNSTEFNLEIINTNDPPILDPIIFPLMRVNLSFSYIVTATDKDITYGFDDYLTFYSYNSSIINITNEGIISFIPAEEHVGNHSVNITVRDKYNASDSVVINFTIYGASLPPNITHIYPYGNPISDITVFEWAERSLFPGGITSINTSENTSMTFNHTSIALPENGNLYYNWYFNDVLVSTSNRSYTRIFNFTSSGIHNLTLVVSDDLAYTTNFTWNISVKNKNRAPVLNGSLMNITVNMTTTYQDYLKKFYDPDGDDLTFNVSYTPLAKITITDRNIRVVPIKTGVDTIRFAASDGNLSTYSNNVTINITGIAEDEEITEQTTGTGGGRTTIEIEVEVPKPTPLKIISPGTITMYMNETVVVPITLMNTWDDVLTGVILSGYTNASGVGISFGENYWDSIPIGHNVTTNMTLVPYRSHPRYEVKVTANVSLPDYSDHAFVYINSIEKGLGRYSEEVTNTKITFARDLFEGNPECIELNEVLEFALKKMHEGDLEKANELIDSTIQACKWLINMKRKEIQMPSPVIDLREVLTQKVLGYLFLAFVLILLISGIIYIKKRISKK